MSKENFEKALNFTFPSEGGYSNNKNDRGGATNMGVTQSTYNAYRKKKNLPYNDVKNITKEEASNLYYEEYWKTSGADKITDPKLAIAMFDTAVLHGPSGAKRLYEQSDGTAEDFLNKRQESYERIIAKDPSQKVFQEGWNNRVNNLKKYIETTTVTNPINKQNNSEIENTNNNESPLTLYGHVEKNINYKDIDNNKVYTFEEIKKMKPKEFLKNQRKILEEFTSGRMMHESEAKEKVKSGELIYVDSYTRQDGTKVSGYYRRR